MPDHNKLDSMSLDELVALHKQQRKELATLKADNDALGELITLRREESTARESMASMSPAKREAYKRAFGG
jgi:hypothetical protein